jgi:FKBP-type peptidyl-prolyl cis-trans isomerase
MQLGRILVATVVLLTVASVGCKKQEEAEKPKRTPVYAPPPPGELPPPPSVAAPPADASPTDSGIACVVLRAGTGTEHPSFYDTVKMHQVVWTTDGKMHMNSGNRGAAVEFDVTQSVLAGLREAIELMVVGEKRRCWIPGYLAFGEAGPTPAPDGRPRGMLVYELDLVSLKKAEGLPEAPEDVAAPPADAQKSASGLTWKVLREGGGGDSPSANGVVLIRYAGWTPDGKVFTATRGTDFKSLSMGSIIPGWREALLTMTAGEKRRLWIPPELAYGGKPGRPNGMVVFDLELVGATQ